jgi:hypothetical protein
MSTPRDHIRPDKRGRERPPSEGVRGRPRGVAEGVAHAAPEMGWASKRNGELLTLAVGQFDVFLTAGRNLSYQQDIAAFDIAVVVLVARSNRFEDLRHLVPQICQGLASYPQTCPVESSTT